MNKLPHDQTCRTASIIACLAVMASGCASIPPPTEQIAVSRSAIANAVSAGSGEYAPSELRAAQVKMDNANRAMEKEDYLRARQWAEEAQFDARLAEKKSHSTKAQRAAIVMQDDIRVLREEINRKSN